MHWQPPAPRTVRTRYPTRPDILVDVDYTTVVVLALRSLETFSPRTDLQQ